MSELETLRDHAQRMAGSRHVDDCMRIHRITKLITPAGGFVDYTLSCASTAGHDPHPWVHPNGLEYDCPGLCSGCMTERERRLWSQVANEVGAHLDNPPDAIEEGLFP